MNKIVLLMCVFVSILTACSGNSENQQSNAAAPSAPISTVKSENIKVDHEKENRDFAFVLVNSRQEFNDIASIGINAYKDFIDKKSNKDEFIQKIESMNTQLTTAFKSLEGNNNLKYNDPNLKSLYDDLKIFVSTYYLDIYYHGLLAQSIGDDKSFQGYMDKSKELESKNREITKKLNDLKSEYKF